MSWKNSEQKAKVKVVSKINKTVRDPIIQVEIGKIGNLQVMLYSSGNFLSRSIPSSLGDLMIIKVLNLSNNQLSSQVPDEIGDLRRLDELNLSNNLIQG